MNDAVSEVRIQVSEAEWDLRVDLAPCYRLVALDDLIFTHISARVPGPDHHFLINPYGLLFEEITASSLVKVDHRWPKGHRWSLRHQPRRIHDPQCDPRGA
jgi:ribulose-5-phosphate 4-epimerase/fuculose-1-phosphate aldolase